MEFRELPPGRDSDRIIAGLEKEFADYHWKGDLYDRLESSERRRYHQECGRYVERHYRSRAEARLNEILLGQGRNPHSSNGGAKKIEELSSEKLEEDLKESPAGGGSTKKGWRERWRIIRRKERENCSEE